MEILILSICFANFIFLVTLSNFLIKMADSISSMKKELEDYYYYIQNKNTSVVVPKKEESGLVDL